MSNVLRNATLSFLDKNPDYEYMFFDDHDATELVYKFSQDSRKVIATCYDKVKPGAYKSDIFRLCALYIFGGIYLDNKVVCLCPLKDYLPKAKVRENTPWFGAGVDFDRRYILNGIMMSTKQNPFILDYISTIVENIKGKKIGRCPLDVTGPGTFGETLNRLLSRDINEPFLDGEEYVTPESGIVETIICWDRSNPISRSHFGSPKLTSSENSDIHVIMFRAGNYVQMWEKGDLWN